MLRRAFYPLKLSVKLRDGTRRLVFTPSAEQAAIVARSRTHNVVVSAKPGAGKTATARAIVDAYPDSRVAVITYSKHLQLSTQAKLVRTRARAFTFHGLARLLFSTPRPVRDDLMLWQLRKIYKSCPQWEGDPYDIVILDELQDCTPLLYWLIRVFLTSLTMARGKAPRIVALGDPDQAIYGYQGADHRYLSLAPDIFDALNPDRWDHMPLNKSYRLSYATSRLVNEAFLRKADYIQGSHPGPRPQYLYSEYDQVLVDKLNALIKEYGAENTAILSPFVRDNDRLSRFEHMLCDRGYAVATSVNDDGPLKQAVVRNKIVLTTYHRFKGSERDLTIVCDVDNLFFRYTGRDLPTDHCPRAVYVALTRAKQQLVIVHPDGRSTMPFVDWDKVKDLADFHNLAPSGQEPKQAAQRADERLQLPKFRKVTALIRHIPVTVLDSLLTKYVKTSIRSPLPEEHHILAPDIIKTRGGPKPLREQVSDINGLVAASLFELQEFGTLSIFSDYGIPNAPADFRDRIKWLTQSAIAYDAKISGYKSRMKQMALGVGFHDYKWFVPYADRALERMTGQFTEDRGEMNFEVAFQGVDFTVKTEGGSHTIGLAGIADIVQTNSSGTKIWEIKFTSSLTPSHVAQLLLYGYLWTVENKKDTMPDMVLFNVQDGAKWEIKATLDGARALIEEIILAKYGSRAICSDEDFLKQCKDIAREVMGDS
ncbi:P-loop containing nucleoside triphosphate hydrolase protein [Heliocybe sulcata]|uniref:P-loop containing nucleoside triphosphate hydrolase protein n=1 Tax=Heliocybe sulcata TaxID=5364 RepID=A0A5C3N528_9AGAM|nr:P-loop containing nucleoside triphosphate hydrolase protein [Heliocybe sulcata]